MYKSVNDTIQCQICHQSLNKAQTLPCTHNYCAGCLQYYNSTNIQRNQNQCPVCQQSYTQNQVYNNIALQKVINCLQLNQKSSRQTSSPDQLEFSNSNKTQENCNNMSTGIQYSPQVQQDQQLNSNTQFKTLNENLSITISNESSSSQTVQSQHFDVFHKQVKKCQYCYQYIKQSKLNEHLKRCNSQLKSNFGIATMKTSLVNQSKDKQNQVKTDKLNKQKEKDCKNDVTLQKGQVTLSTNIKKIKTDLIHFGFKLTFINTIKNKQQLCDIYNKFILKYKTYFTNGYNSDLTGLRVMICDDILQDYEQSKNVKQELKDIKEQILSFNESASDITEYEQDKKKYQQEQQINKQVNKQYFDLCNQLLIQLIQRADKQWLVKARQFLLKSRKPQSQYSID